MVSTARSGRPAPTAGVAENLQAPLADAPRDANDCDACQRESARLEANKTFATRMLQMSDNPVLAAREYGRFVRDLNAAINVHNAVCKRYPVSPLPL